MDRVGNARRLRQEQTGAERKLWSILRGWKLDGFKFRRQMPIDRYFADFACVEAKLVIELDGGQHAERVAYDAARTEVLEGCGWTVRRFWNAAVLTETTAVVDAILRELRLARP
ncbi:endonuclease domain-containing protein [Caulobacter mirabilis]|uniref:Endonuclease n=1 Tax=Caulobacter mirabilis TaxID=69666 RepID=A0A2D2AYT2_9CAUL|nr:endonuclease domain-containing protein [Caulobacter mirabilis]ATQ43170.1 endonuclease [Caulobacter mirabilis]